ncbi:MAG: S1 RNA-binding domain-containing protein [Oscillospiraceae bacterium]|nr:S1 RNA-binding domain-containing protein [Oscillospiraceae bacterium]
MVSVGNIIEGKVISVMPFGVFVDLGNKKSGLVHISEISSKYVKDINQHVKKGDVLKVKVIKIDDKGKISLSVKQAEEPKKPKDVKEPPKENKPVRPVNIDWGAKESENLSFEDKLSKFKQDSDEKIQALRRSADSKRSGGYSRKSNHSF